MKAMILAAGRGERMRPLTDTTPKPLLEVNGKPLIVYHVKRLVAAGLVDIVINVAWLGDRIIERLGDGKQFGANIQYSQESEALETAGGIVKALPLLTNVTLTGKAEHEFIVVNADIWCDYNMEALINTPLHNDLACLVLVKTPSYLTGDFLLKGDRILHKNTQTLNPESSEPLTYSGIARYSSKMFANLHVESLPLRPLLDKAIDNQTLAGLVINNQWLDVGTPERLSQLNRIR